MLLLPGGRFGRRGVRAARRLRDFTGCDFEFVRFLSVRCKTKKFLEFQFHARRKKESASSLRSTRALRVDDDERSTPSHTKKRRCPTTIARAPLFFFVAVLFDYTSHFATTIPLSRFNKSSKRRGECVCVCVWISVKISPFATTLSFFTPTSRLEEAFEKRTGSLFCVFERTFSSTDLHVQCVDFSFFFYRVQKP